MTSTRPSPGSPGSDRTLVVRFALSGLLLAATHWVAGCGGGSTGGTSPPSVDPGSGDFAVTGTTVSAGAVWKLNQAMEIDFNEDVDFGTVSLATIQVVDGLGVQATGTFTEVTPRTIRFQPTCPTEEAGASAGLNPAGSYRLIVPSAASSGGGVVTVQNTLGQRLQVGLDVAFTTPASADPVVLFEDPVAGPPAVRIRGLNGEPLDSRVGSFVQFGSDPANVEFFEFDGSLTPPQGVIASLVPLNLYSRVEDQFSIVLNFDQPVFAGPSNISPTRLGIEYESPPGSSSWLSVPTTPELLANCTESGAAVRISPNGIVPQGARLRAVVRAGFQDLVGEAVPSLQADFARFASEVANPGAVDPGAGSDEILETFSFGGGVTGSLEDTSIASGMPRASWSGAENPGTLAASFDFPGTGGPNGEFDVLIRAGQTVFINTDLDTIIGGPGGAPTNQVEIVGGVLDVRDFTVEANARVLFVGSNPATILATGSVLIEGSMSLNGGDSNGVATLNTTNQPEVGAAGLAGGGRGGTGSYLTTESTPAGGAGAGAFQVPGLGGQGGETGYASPIGTAGRESRRGGGGGGGRLGRDVRYEFDNGSGGVGLFRCQSLVGMDAEPGFHGSLDGTGAVSQSTFAMGGAMSPFPFVDPSPNNDFFGTMITASGEQILGELPSIWAGAGGGAGGDAVSSATFPRTPFTITGDEKGSGGGGGAGGLLVLAVGNIEIRDGGELTADGGSGGGGENVVFFDRIGAGSGGGSGGHIVLSSASSIIVRSESTAVTTGLFYSDDPLSATHEKRPLRALGGQGGCGRESRCGSNENGDTRWRGDAIPPEAFEGNSLIPPQGQFQFSSCNQVGVGQTQPAEGVVIGGGGDGGPGIIQLHVMDPQVQLLFPNRVGETYGVNLDPTLSMVPPPLGWTRPDDPVDVMVPLFGTRSDAYSRWIPLGLARLNPDGSSNQVEFLFGGTDTMTGSVLRDGNEAQQLAPVLPYAPLSMGGALPSVDVASGTFTIPGAGIDELYRRNGALMRHFALRVRGAASPAVETEFVVQMASYDPSGTGADEFELVVDPRGAELADLLAVIAAPEIEVVPFFFRLRSAGVNDAFPLGTDALISFDATLADPVTGAPSQLPADSLSGGDLAAFTPDISMLDAAAWDFVRFKVEFNLGMSGSGVDPLAPRPALDFLRLPFRF